MVKATDLRGFNYPVPLENRDGIWGPPHSDIADALQTYYQGDYKAFYQDMFTRSKNMGVKAARVSFYRAWLEVPFGSKTFDVNYLNIMDDVVELTANLGINVVLTMPVVGLPPDYSLGESPPQWFSYPNKNDSFWQDSVQQSSWIEVWKMLTERYKNYTHLSFDVLNEPATYETNADLTQEFTDHMLEIYDACSRAIHTIDPNRTILVEAAHFSQMWNLMKPLTDPNPNIIYSPHLYWVPANGYTMLDDIFSAYTGIHMWVEAKAFAKKYNVPMVIGEWGAQPATEYFDDVSRQFFQDLTSEANNLGWGWFYFKYWGCNVGIDATVMSDWRTPKAENKILTDAMAVAPVVPPVQGVPIWVIPVVLFGLGVTYILAKKK